MDLTEAEDIKKRWQEYTEKLYKKDIYNQDNHDGVITHLESDILECEVKWALESITMNKASGGSRLVPNRKRLHQGCILSPCLFNRYAGYIMRNPGLEEAQTGIKISRRNINILRYTDDTTLMAEREEKLKSHLMKVKEESEKVGLKLNIQKTKTMASGTITSWQIDGETLETVSDFIFGGSKITADGDCSHEIKRRLLLGRKVMTNLDSIFKSRHYFAKKGSSSQDYGFSCGHVWM